MKWSKKSFPSWQNASRKLRFTAVAMGAATILIPLGLYSYDYSVWQLVLAMILLDLCLYPTFRHLARREGGLPVMPVLGLSFAVQYAMPIFTQEAKVELVGQQIVYVENQSVLAALVLSTLGVAILQLTYYTIRDNRITKTIPALSLQLSATRAEFFCIAVFTISLLVGRVQNLLSAETYLQFSAIFNLLQNQLLVAIAILTWLAFSVRRHKRHVVMLYFLVAFTALRGFSTTMLEVMIVPLAVLFIGKWTYTKTVPIASLSVIAVVFLFLSPVKMDIRRVVLEDVQVGRSGSIVGRASDWVSQASDFWWETVSGRRGLGESTADASSRTDLIHEFAYIHSMTPSAVPYQNGATYQYLAIAFIPRIFWPEKPQANYANNFYALEYGISTEEGIKTSSFGFTLLGEGYSNFGPTGSLLTMLILGLMLASCEHVFGSERTGVGGQAIFLGIFIYALNGIGSSTELMFGGMVQNLIASYILLLWARKKKAPGTQFQLPFPALKIARALGTRATPNR